MANIEVDRGHTYGKHFPVMTAFLRPLMQGFSQVARIPIRLFAVVFPVRHWMAYFFAALSSVGLTIWNA